MSEDESGTTPNGAGLSYCTTTIPLALSLFREIIFGYDGPGIPIGNLTSQYLANLYLSEVDHYFKEVFHAHCYLRYMDDVVVLGREKRWLRRVKSRFEQILGRLRLAINPRWQISPVYDRGVDFVGYRTFGDHILLRNRTKSRLRSAVSRIRRALSFGAPMTVHEESCVASYSGILGWCDGFRLKTKYLCPLL